MNIPVVLKNCLVMDTWSEELAEATEHYVFSSAAKPSEVLIGALLGVLRGGHTSLPLFAPGEHSLFKLAVARLPETSRCWTALGEVCDADVVAAANVARWCERLEQVPDAFDPDPEPVAQSEPTRPRVPARAGMVFADPPKRRRSPEVHEEGVPVGLAACG